MTLQPLSYNTKYLKKKYLKYAVEAICIYLVSQN